MESKDVGVDIDNIIMRIKERQARRDELSDMMKTESIESLNDQALGRIFRDTGTAAKAPARTLTIKDIEEAAKKLGIHKSVMTAIKPRHPLPLFDDYIPYESPLRSKELEFKITPFSMHSISLVSNPEPGCEIKVSPEDAFDYAMKMLDK